MKSLLVVVLAALVAGCGTVRRVDSSKLEIIPVPQGLQNPAVFEEFLRKIEAGKPVILKVAQGERMPFKLGMDLPMGALEPSQSTFHFTRDTYFLLSKKGLALSPDGQRWAGVAHLRAINKLFGVEHGQLSFGFASATNDPPHLKLEIKSVPARASTNSPAGS